MDDCTSTPLKSAATSKVRVIVRVRPFLSHENADQRPCISILGREIESSDGISVYLKDQETSRNECYRLDSFFGQDDHNVGRIFEREVMPLIPGIFQGFNASVFAYGATGSGKTYTMQGTEDELGLMPLAMASILSMCETTGSKAKISYYEVYLDKCYDLLELKPKEIPVWEDKDGKIHLNGLCRAPVTSMIEFNDVFSCGVQRRKVAHTGLNDVSSRSHGVLVIWVTMPCVDGSEDILLGKLNLVDLAGNEDNRRACNEGIRLQESAKINQSLFALSNVIFALNNKTRVPYRDSKLTRILQDSLGGKTRALMVACLNPGEYQQSVHTVSLAARSRNISNFVPLAHKPDTPKVKVDMETKLRAWLELKGKSTSSKHIGVDNSPFLGKNTPSISSMKKLNCKTSSVKSKFSKNLFACNKQGNVSVPFKNLDDYEDVQDLNLDSSVAKEERKQPYPVTIKESNGAESLDKQSNWDESLSLNVATSPPMNEMKMAFKTRPSMSKILSPIDSNILSSSKEFSFNEDRSCSLLFELKTPNSPSVFAYNLGNDGTPLDKFNARSCNIKNYLVQEYINFINTASREELLGLKGIGVKIAEYILELREESPIKSLTDLENIGLSRKQVLNLFNRTARVIFNIDEKERNV